MAPCPDLKEDYTEDEKLVQVLQRNTFSRIHVFSCLVEITRNVFRCGMFSHISLLPSGLLSYVLDLSAEDCRILQRTRALNLYGTHLITGLQANASTTQSVTLAGKIGTDGSCESSSFSQFGETFETAVVQASVKVTLNDYETLLKLEENSVSLRNNLNCQLSKGYCVDSVLGMSVWDINQAVSCSENDISVLYEGIASFITVKNPSSDTTSRYVVVEQLDHVFALQLQDKVGLCHQDLFSTEHPRLLVAIERSYGFKFTMNQPRLTENTNLLSYMNSKFLYVEVTFKQALNKLHKNAIHRRCLLHREILKNRLLLAPLSPNAVALLLQNEPGYIGSILGECLVVAKCTPRPATLRREKRCFKQLAVTVDNQSLFISPLTHILQKHAEQISCNEVSAPLYNIEGSWIGFNPGPQYHMQPKILIPDQEINLNFTPVNLGKAGLYGYSEIQGLQDILLFGLERDVILNVLVRKMSNLSVDDQGISSALLFNEKDLEILASTTLSYLWQYLLNFGSVFSAIYGIYFIYRIIKYLLSMGLHALTLYNTIGVSWKLLASCCTPAALLVVQHEHLKTRKEAEQTEQSTAGKNKQMVINRDDNAILTGSLQVDSSAMQNFLAQGQSAWH